MSGNYYSIDIWGLLIALVMVAVAAGISEAMRMGIGKTLLWSACRALLQLCAMGFIMEFVIKSNNPWLVLLLVMFMLIAAVQITLSRAKGVPKGLAGPVFLSLVITMLIMISLVTELIIRPQPWYAPQLVVPLTGMLLGNTAADASVALVVGLTLAVTVLVAKLIGCTLPLLAKCLKLDPAVMASPFITTIVDAVSLLVYFAVASSMLQMP